MLRRLTPAQIRGARGMLDWSRADLALAASMSVTTVKRVEQGSPLPVSDDVYSAIQIALEKAGLRFLREGEFSLGMMLDLR